MFNKKCIALVLIIMMVAVPICSMASAGSVLKSDDVGASASKVVTPGPILDNFNSAAAVNAWNMSTSAFSSSEAVPPPSNAKCTASFTASGAYGGSGYSLKLDYNVGLTNGFAGYVSQLGGGSLASPTAYKALSFYVKGAVGGEFFKVQLKNTGTALYPYTYSGGSTSYRRNTASVYITDYLDGGVATIWQKVTIPLDNFVNLDGWTSMAEFAIVFENAQSVANGSLTSGTIYIDNIQFETTVPSILRIAHFGEAVYIDPPSGNKKGICIMGGNIGTGAGGGAVPSLNTYSLTNVSNEYYLYLNGMKIVYDVTFGFAFTYLIFGGGQDINTDPLTSKSGWIALPHDFSAYNYLSFNIRASDAGNPKVMKIEVEDNGGKKDVAIGGITTAWKRYNIPLVYIDGVGGFTGLDKTTIKQVNFTLEGSRIGANSGSKTGTVFIDSIQFEQ